MYRLGIDIGGTKINVGIVSYDREKADVVALCKLEVKSIDNVTLEIKRAVDLLCGEIGISVADIERCGVGIPGTVSRDGKRILKAPNIAILSEDFAGKLENALSLPVSARYARYDAIMSEANGFTIPADNPFASAIV
jgi:glucokinase